MKTKLFFLLIIAALASCTTKTSNNLTNQEKLSLLNAIHNDTLFASWVEDTSNAIKLYKQYKVNVIKSDSSWESDQQRLQKIEDFGYTNKFELIPLVENLHGNAAFKEAWGVSYLIRTDHSTILFDTGIDEDSIMCVLRYNLNILGIDISEIDAIFISHNHGDHQNNWKWINDRTFVNSENENILPGIKIYVPGNDLNLKIPAVFSKDPVKISEGVYTTGIIQAPMFFSSSQEQGLMFNVKDKGIIVVTGCGHQTVEKLLQRCEKLSNTPIYGVLGGLHLPVDNDSERYMSFYITGKLPWEPFTVDNVNKKIEFIKKRNLKLIGISTHDSSPIAVEAFKTAFSKEYKDLSTGEWIVA
jgi:7,8-dihydropterin-6-yl-methyl-4-(beta-D-ribofuranosyl)aminobenzene 5'-phosphate synthase